MPGVRARGMWGTISSRLPFLCLRFLGYEGDIAEITASLFKNHLALFQLSLSVLRTKPRLWLSPQHKPVKSILFKVNLKWLD